MRIGDTVNAGLSSLSFLAHNKYNEDDKSSENLKDDVEYLKSQERNQTKKLEM